MQTPMFKVRENISFDFKEHFTEKLKLQKLMPLEEEKTKDIENALGQGVESSTAAAVVAVLKLLDAGSQRAITVSEYWRILFIFTGRHHPSFLFWKDLF